MKMKRYVAADMRAALRAIREEQGPDAVILSTRARSRKGSRSARPSTWSWPPDRARLAETAALKQLERAALHELERDALPMASGARTARLAALDAPALPARRSGSAVERCRSADAQRLGGEELRSLRALLEQQLAALAWNDFTRREPLKARALADLANLGRGAHAGAADRR